MSQLERGGIIQVQVEVGGQNFEADEPITVQILLNADVVMHAIHMVQEFEQLPTRQAPTGRCSTSILGGSGEQLVKQYYSQKTDKIFFTFRPPTKFIG